MFASDNAEAPDATSRRRGYGCRHPGGLLVYLQISDGQAVGMVCAGAMSTHPPHDFDTLAPELRLQLVDVPGAISRPRSMTMMSSQRRSPLHVLRRQKDCRAGAHKTLIVRHMWRDYEGPSRSSARPGRHVGLGDQAAARSRRRRIPPE